MWCNPKKIRHEYARHHLQQRIDAYRKVAGRLIPRMVVEPPVVFEARMSAPSPEAMMLSPHVSRRGKGLLGGLLTLVNSLVHPKPAA
jgi:hypothetical protein